MTAARLMLFALFCLVYKKLRKYKKVSKSTQKYAEVCLKLYHEMVWQSMKNCVKA
jgi:hypothetical protein